MEKVLNKTLPEREFRPYRRPLSIPLANAKETIQQKIGYLLRERISFPISLAKADFQWNDLRR